MKYSNWPDKNRKVSILRLDPRNPRIPSANDQISQRELIEELVYNDNVYDLAKNIVEVGYMPLESLLSIRKNNIHYIVEGNRRLAALKLLHNPESGPTNFVSKFKHLSNKIDTDTVKSVKVLTAPSREAAIPIVLNRHTQKQVEAWAIPMQAKFYWQLIDGGLSIDDISETYNIKRSDINILLNFNTLYLHACTLKFSNDISSKVRNPRDFPATTLQRLMMNTTVKTFLGIEFENNEIRGNIQKGEFNKGLKKILTDLAEKNQTSRSLNKDEQIQAYLKTFKADKPDLNKKGKFRIDSYSLMGKSTLESHQHKVSKAKPKVSSGVIPIDFICKVTNERVKKIFNELKELKLKKNPNAIGILLRVLLELSLSEYLNNQGHLNIIIANAKLKNKGHIKDDWNPSLRIMLNYVVNDPNIIKRTKYKSTIRKFLSGEHKTFSLDTFNNYIHNETFLVNENTVHQLWSELEELFKITLSES